MRVLFLSYKTSVLLSCLILGSCIGTVNEVKSKANKSVDVDLTSLIEFDGGVEGIGIAHNKIALFFYPATGSSGNFSYLVYEGGNFGQPVASIDGDLIELDDQGLAQVVVSNNLNINTTYSFIVRAFDKENKFEDGNLETVQAKTLGDIVPSFSGITSLEQHPGSLGKSALIVKWNQATKSSGSNLFDDEFTPSGYEVQYGTSRDSLNQSKIVAGEDTLETVISGLSELTKYHVRVIARDSAHIYNSSFSVPRFDNNHKIVSQSTLGEFPIEFGGLITASIPNSGEGFSKANLSWNAGFGNFDVYKVYVEERPNGAQPRTSFDPSTDSSVGTIGDLSSTSFVVSGLTPNKTYDMAIVACENEVCSVFSGHQVVRSVTTTPELAPFDGLVSVTSVEDLAGLSSLRLNWNNPDSSQGVFDGHKYFLYADSSGTAPTEIPSCGSSPGNICFETSEPLPQSVVIENLTTNITYFFGVKIINSINSPLDPSPRIDSNTVVRSGVPQYTAPVFNGADSCTATDSNKIQLSWTKPTGGTYTNMELIVKKVVNGENFSLPVGTSKIDAGVTVDGYTDSASSFESGPEIYRQILVGSSAISWEVDGLSPGTDYQFSIQSYLSSNGTTYRDLNSKVVTCRTQSVKAQFNGWYDLMSVGPRIDGLNQKAMSEHINPFDGTDLLNGIHQPYPRVISDYEMQTGFNGDISKKGIVRVVWNDFTLADGSGTKIYDIVQSLGEQGNGYNVYRADWESSQENPPNNPANPLPADESPSQGRWVKVNTELIRPVQFVGRAEFSGDPRSGTQTVAEFIDSDFSDHPGVDSNDDVISSGKNKSKIYWYRVVPVIGNVELEYDQVNTMLDLKIQVAVPPNNMALIHRWIANQQMCEKLGLKDLVERNRNYRCEYDGIGSVKYISAPPAEQGKRYYDVGEHILSDRFGMGVRFTRGNASGGACTKITSRDNGFGYESFLGDSVYTDTPMANYEGVPYDKAEAELLSGDCIIASNAQADDVTAPIGSMMMQRGVNMPRMWIRNTFDQWFEAYSLLGADSTSTLDKNNILSHMDNSSRLPVMRGMNHLAASRTCEVFSTEHKGASGQHHMMRMREFALAIDYSQTLTKNTRDQIISGSFEQGSGPEIRNDSVFDRDCSNENSMGQDTTLYPLVSGTNTGTDDNSSPSLKNNRYPMMMFSLSGHNRQFSVTGSFGNRSRERCTSRYGIQDLSGNYAHLLSDSFWCDYSRGTCSAGFKDELTQTTYTPDHDPFNKNLLKNIYIDGGVTKKTYLQFSEGSDSLAHRMRNSILFSGESSSTSLRFDDVSNYYSPALNFPLECKGNLYCDNANKNVTHKVSATGATVSDWSLKSAQYFGTDLGLFQSAPGKVFMTMSSEDSIGHHKTNMFKSGSEGNSFQTGLRCSVGIDQDSNIDWSE